MGKRPASRDDDDAADVDREAECRGTLRALNAQFAAWVATRAVESPIVSWAEGCRDYLKHLDALKRDFSDVLETTTTTTSTANDGVKPTADSTSKPKLDAAPSGAANPFGGAPAIPAAGSIFGKLPTAPGSAFGGVGGASGSLFPPAGGLFGAGAAAPGGAVNAGGDDEDEDEPPRPSSPSYKADASTEDERETVLLRVGKVKFHTKKDASDTNWADRGVNSFEFRREKEPSEGGKRKCRLLMRNTIGKAVLNAGLYANMSAQTTEKKLKDGSVMKNGIMTTVFNAEEENQKVMVYLRFGKESDAVEAHKLISEHVAEL